MAIRCRVVVFYNLPNRWLTIITIGKKNLLVNLGKEYHHSPVVKGLNGRVKIGHHITVLYNVCLN